jgi:hypothetical protein
MSANACAGATAQSSCVPSGCPWPCAYDPNQFPLRTLVESTVLAGSTSTVPVAAGLTFAGIQNQVPYNNTTGTVQLNDLFTIVQNFSHSGNENNLAPWGGILLAGDGDPPSQYLPIVCNTATGKQKGYGSQVPMLFTVCRNPGPTDSLIIMPTNQQLAATAPLMQVATAAGMTGAPPAEFMAFVSGATSGSSGASGASGPQPPQNLRHGFAVDKSQSPAKVYLLYSDTGTVPPNPSSDTLAACAIQTNSITSGGAYWSVYASIGTGYVLQDAAAPTSCSLAKGTRIMNTDGFEWAYAAQLNLQFRAVFKQINQLQFTTKVPPIITWTGRLQYVSAWGCECGDATAPSSSQCFTGSTGNPLRATTSSTCYSSSCTTPCVSNVRSLAPHREFTDLGFGESALCYQALYGETYALVTWTPTTPLTAEEIAQAQAANPPQPTQPYTLTYCAPPRNYFAPGIAVLYSYETDQVLSAQRPMFVDVRNTDTGGSNIYFWTTTKPAGTSSEADPPTNPLSKENGLFGKKGGSMSIWGIIGIVMLVIIGLLFLVMLLGIGLKFKTVDAFAPKSKLPAPLGAARARPSLQPPVQLAVKPPVQSSIQTLARPATSQSVNVSQSSVVSNIPSVSNTKITSTSTSTTRGGAPLRKSYR